ncbi:condensin-2 complex subunit D3-L-like isoform X1 [Cloeon dipterum]|uniref:condensin-2 complex subunit D3-L-like isoform X1 n=1 Tax=Cloeon dipterum TaxID=197152 RepID=UPI00321FED7D
MELASKFAKWILPIDERFVDAAWVKELFEIDSGPYDDDEDFEMRVNNLIDASETLRRAFESPGFRQGEFSAQFWCEMKSRGLHHRNLLPYISYFASSYSKNPENLKADIVGLIVASVYLKLLSLPGAVVYDMFHQVIYDYCVDKLCMASNQKQTGKKRNAGSQSWQYNVTKKVDVLLDDLTRLQQAGFLTDRNLAINVTVKRLTEMLSGENVLIRDFSIEEKSLAYKAYKALFTACDEQVNTSLVLEQLLSNTLSLSTPLSQVRHHFETVSNFVAHLLATKEAKDVWAVVIVFVQQLLARSVERAESRQQAAHLTTTLLAKMPRQLRNCVLRWAFTQLAFSERSTHRLITLELFHQILQLPEFDDCDSNELVKEEENEEEEPEENDPLLHSLVHFPFSGGSQAIRHIHILCLVLFRVDDVAPMIRTKALNMLSDILLCADKEPLAQVVQETFVVPITEPVEIECRVSVLWQGRFDFLRLVLDNDAQVPSATMIANLLAAISDDERVYVRKAALQALVSLAKLSHHWLSPSFLELLSSHCRDPAVMIRKQVIICMSELLKEHFESIPSVVENWVLSVLPCLQDPESKAQELVQEHFHDVFFENMRAFNPGMSGQSLLPWNILRLAAKFNLKKLLSDSFKVWAKEKRLPNNFVAIVKSYIETSFNKEAWMLLAILSESQNIPDVLFAHEYFKQHSQQIKKISVPFHESYIECDNLKLFFNKLQTEISTMYLVMRVLMLDANSLGADETKELSNLLCKKVENLSFATDLIGTAIDLIAAIDIANKQMNAFQIWCKAVHKKLDSKICLYLSREGHAPPDSTEEIKMREITTLGDVVRASSMSDYSYKLSLALISVVLHGQKDAGTCNHKELAFAATPRLRAAATVALGKMAILQEQVAFQVVSVFQHLLKTSSDNILRCNVLTVLADLIGKYATLVESIVAEIEMCLHDPDADMRRHALIVVVQLLQGDFVKLKGTTLLFYLLTTLCDPESDLRDMTASYLTNTLIAKEPNIFQQNIISAIVLLNAYENHNRFSKIKVSQEKVKKLALVGVENTNKRMLVYTFMLEYMSDDHRFDSLHRICTQILGGFVDGLFLLGTEDHILADALAVLSCEQIRLRCMKVTSEGDATDADEAFSKLYDQTKKLFVAQEVKKKIMENIVPIIKSLRVKLRKARSPLGDDLMRFLRDLMRDFKSEIDEIFAGDKQLVEEIAFDLRQLEEQEKAGNGEEDDQAQDSD